MKLNNTQNANANANANVNSNTKKSIGTSNIVKSSEKIMSNNKSENSSSTKNVEDAAVYTKSKKLSSEEVKELVKSQANFRIESFSNLISSMTTKQAHSFKIPNMYSVLNSSNKLKTLSSKNFEDYFNSPNNDDKDSTAKNIANKSNGNDSEDNDYYSAKNTSERIISMAKNFANNDLNKLSTLKDAIQKGFDSAKNELGGKLPPVCEETVEIVMSEIDKMLGLK